MASTSPIWFSIPEFYGIQQNKDGRLLPIGTAYDARNIDTSDGNLRVAKGYKKRINTVVPGNDRIRKLIPYGTAPAGANPDFYVVTDSTIYYCQTNTSVWQRAYDDDEDADFSFGYNAEIVTAINARIGEDDVILVCSNNNQITIIYSGTKHVRKFGTGLYSYQGTVQSYSSGTLTITLGSNMTDEAKRRALAYGVTYGGSYYASVYEIPSGYDNKIVLAEVPDRAPQANDDITIRGGGSDVAARYLAMYAGRLFAASDPSNSCRLYWSTVPGDGRTIEDWLSVNGSEDASGGYVDVGTEYDDDPINGLTVLSNQLIIWKQHSVWRLFGDRPSTFTLECIEENAPVLVGSSQFVYHDAPYILGDKGLYTYDTVGVVLLDNGTSFLKRYMNTLSGDIRHSRSVVFNNRFYISAGGKYATSKDTAIIVFDVATGSYMVRDGFSLEDIVAFRGMLFMINEDRYVCEFESGTSYNGNPIHAYWQTQPIDFGRKMYRHQLMGLYMQLTGGDVKINIIGDYAGSTKELVAKKDTSRKGYIAVRVQTDQSNEFSLKFDNKTGENTYTDFAIEGGMNIKALGELKE